MQMQSFTALFPCHTSLFCFPTKHCCCLVKINCRWRKNIKIALSASTLQLPWATTIVAIVAANGSKEVSLIVCKINTMLVRAAPVRSSCPPWVEGLEVMSWGRHAQKKSTLATLFLFCLAFNMSCQGWLPVYLSNGVTITKKAHISYTRFRVTMWDKFLKGDHVGIRQKNKIK